jgi:DNA repair and recombination protein RAD54B
MEDESNGFSSTTAVGAASFYAKPPKAPTKKIVIGEKNSKEREAWGGALHDPNAEGAVVMPRPNDEAIKERGVLVNDVVIDPHLSSKMREHQKKGVEVR